jgi:hypothetical protein
MGYSNSTLVNTLIANTLTTGTSPVVNGSPTPLINFGSTFKTNLVSSDIVAQYIAWADDEINAAISEMYAVPLAEKADLEIELLSDIDEYNDTIEINQASLLNVGDIIVFIDGNQEERHVVESVSGNESIDIQDTLVGFYYANSARVLRVKYPDPITLISTRLAAASIFDKFFAGAAPNESEFSKMQKKAAYQLLNNIVNGRTILHGARRIGRRFYESNLDDRYGLPPIDGDNSRDVGGQQ